MFWGVEGLRGKSVGDIDAIYSNRRWLYGCEVPGRFLRAAVVGPQEAAYSQQCVFSGTCEKTSSRCSKPAAQQLAFFEQLGCHSDTQQTKRFVGGNKGGGGFLYTSDSSSPSFNYFSLCIFTLNGNVFSEKLWSEVSPWAQTSSRRQGRFHKQAPKDQSDLSQATNFYAAAKEKRCM